jgi:hypothetical protein
MDWAIRTRASLDHSGPLTAAWTSRSPNPLTVISLCAPFEDHDRSIRQRPLAERRCQWPAASRTDDPRPSGLRLCDDSAAPWDSDTDQPASDRRMAGESDGIHAASPQGPADCGCRGLRAPRARLLGLRGVVCGDGPARSTRRLAARGATDHVPAKSGCAGGLAGCVGHLFALAAAHARVSMPRCRLPRPPRTRGTRCG